MKISCIFSEEFNIFYGEFLRCKEQALRLSYQEVLHAQDDSSDGTVTGLQQQLCDFFSEQYLRLSRTAFAPFLQEMQYLMVALCDDFMISLSWKGHELWKNYPLEAKLFSTQIAGEAIFKRIDRILYHHDFRQKELAMLYLFSLGLGFLGQYQNYPQDDYILYKKRLHQFVCGTNAQAFWDRTVLIEQPYQYPYNQGGFGFLPSLKKWGYVFLGSIGLYLLINFLLWRSVSHDVRLQLEKLNQIQRLEQVSLAKDNSASL